MITILGALLLIAFLNNPFQGILWSQIILSIQLPWTIVALIVLTSSSRVMGGFVNPVSHKILLWITALIVSFLNVMLLIELM
jgi:manganese transport protein